jgi:hypothetical protein
MSERSSYTVKDPLVKLTLAVVCTYAGGVAGSYGLEKQHNDMADRVVDCVEREPDSEAVTALTQYCLDEAPTNDPTLVGSPVYQEFALGTPFDELRTVSQQYRENSSGEGVLLGMFIGGVVAAAGISVYNNWPRRSAGSANSAIHTTETAGPAPDDLELELTTQLPLNDSGARGWSDTEVSTPAEEIQEPSSGSGATASTFYRQAG